MFLPILFATTVALTTLSPSPTITPPEPSISPDIENLRKVVQEKVQEKIKEIVDNVLPERRAWKGIVQSVSPLEIQIQTSQGETKTLSIKTETIILDGTRTKMDVGQVKTGMEVLALGFTSDNTTLEVKRLIATPPEKPQPTDIIFTGVINDISKATKTIFATSLVNKTQEYQILLDAKTKLTDITSKDISSTSITKSQRAIIILRPRDTNQKTYIARQIIFFSAPLTPTPTPKP